ncbi:MAG: hypothetical protein K2P67_07170 [Gallionellaceae bacterium]|nr:hypothetical protein [Gallionellaceae bacterium]
MNTPKIEIDLGELLDALQAMKTLMPKINFGNQVDMDTGILPVNVTMSALLDKAHGMARQLYEPELEGSASTPADTLGHFYDLRALAMSASAMTRNIKVSAILNKDSAVGGDSIDHLQWCVESSDELNAIRRVLSCLADKALEFANEEDEHTKLTQ